jgi:S1-C subfamily serine protease
MEDLNKNQIVLLTLLVSFVTSIATGIITTSLLQEAPIEVVRNINRVVEKTIEKVAPDDLLAALPKAKEVTTIVVKEDDSIIQSIDKNLNSIVRVHEINPGISTNLYGIGLVLTKDGTIAAERKTIYSQFLYAAIMSDGTEVKLAPVGADKKTDFILFKAVQPDKVSSSTPPLKLPVFSPAILSEGEPKLGQTVIGLGGEIENTVAVGRVTALQIKDSGVGTSTVKYLSNIDTDISSKDLLLGSPLFNLSGEVVGIKLSSDVAKSFVPINILKKEIPTLTEAPKN